MSKTKYIVVLGGNLSGLGKGLVASSIAANLDWLGYKVRYLKLDGYLNTNAGTINPTEHGELWVTQDGLEADMDLGHFERFTGQETNKKSSLTAGKVYSSVLRKENEGEFLGKTIQMNTHITQEIVNSIRDSDCDFKIIEVGGTVGDIENQLFLEAIRKLKRKEEICVVELVFVPYLEASKEYKTRLAQVAVAKTRQSGVEPDIVLARTQRGPTKVPDSILTKIYNLTDVPTFLAEDLDNVYKIPINIWERSIIDTILNTFSIERSKENNEKYQSWKTKVNKKYTQKKKIVIAGKYDNGPESYKSIVESLYHAGTELDIEIDIDYSHDIANVNAIIIPGGFGYRGIEDKINVIKQARENKIPIIGICYGMQLMAIEYARNVLNIQDATSEEWDITGTPIISYMPGQKEAGKVGTMRLGKYKSSVYAGTPLEDIYKSDFIWERHRHRLEFLMSTYKKHFNGSELKIGGTGSIQGEDDRLIEMIYLENQPLFVGVQFHPEFTSKFLTPHPLFIELLKKSK